MMPFQMMGTKTLLASRGAENHVSIMSDTVMVLRRAATARSRTALTRDMGNQVSQGCAGGGWLAPSPRMLGPRLGATQESLTAADELACRMAAVSGPNLFCAEVLRPATSSAPTLSLHTAPAALGARVPHPSNAACTDGACKVVVTDAVAGDGAGPCHCQGGMPDTAVSGSAAMAPRESSGGSGGKSEQGPWLGTSLESFRAEGLQLLSQGFGVSLDVDKIELN
eukprot:jgi/Mesvir1/20674/Mv14888-RA.1